MAYLSQHPDHLKGLVLLGAMPPKRPSTPEELGLLKQSDEDARAFLKRSEISAQIHKEGLDRRQEELSAKQKTDSWRINFAGVNMYHVERWRKMRCGQIFYNEKSGTAAAKTLPEMWDFMPALAAHVCPLFILLGDHDFIDFGEGMWRHWTTGLPNAHLTMLKEAGHNAWLDSPTDFRALLLEALHDSAACRPNSR